MRSFLLSAGLSFLFALSIFAQSDRGTITGTVSDPAGAVVAGAQIEARHVDSGTTYNVASTGTGNFTLAQLPIGNYELTVTVTGFKKFVRQNLTVGVASTSRVDVVLQVGATTESITVSESTPLLKTESGEISHNFDSDRLNSLPVVNLGTGTGSLGNVRNPLSVVNLMPGAAFQNDNTLRINGMPSSTQAIRVEGQDATNGIWRQINQESQPSLDAVQEVAVQTSNYAAEYGQAGGGYFNFTMKSGTNQYHGGAYDYFVNEALNAGTPFTDAGLTNALKDGQHIRNRQRKNDYGFTFGGPITIPKIYDGHDKTFFFFNFEQYRESLNVGTGTATVPIDAYQVGNFAGAQGVALPLLDPLGRKVFQNQIFDPNSQTTAADGSLVRTPFPNNAIPLSSIDPVAAKVQAMLPQATNGAKTNNYTIPAYSNFRHTTIPSFKLDHNLSSKIKLSAYFSYTHTVSPSANGFTQVFSSAEPADTESTTTRINYDQTISPTMLLHLGIGLLNTNRPAIPQSFDQGQFWAPNQQFYINQFPNIGGLNDVFNGGNSIGLGSAFGATFIKDLKPTGNASLTWVRGNHTIKLGGEMVVEGIPTLNTSRASGVISFSKNQTGEPWELGQNLNGLTTGFGYASFLLGAVGGFNITPVAETRLGNHSFAMYLQDTWKVTRKLTLDYGLRYDYVTELKEQYGRMQNAAFNTPNPNAGGRNGTVIYEGDGGGRCDCHFQSNYPYAIGPRLGVAYQINSKTVFRAGAGLAYGTAPNNAFLSYSVNDFYPVTPAYGQVVSQLKDGNPYQVGNPFGNPPFKYPDFTPHFPFATAPGVVPPVSVFISIDRNAGRPPRIFQWSLGLQREISRDLVVEAAYVGNRGVWWTAPLLATQNYNALKPEDLANVGIDLTKSGDRALLTQPIASASVISRFPYLANPNNVYPGFPNNQQLIQALKPYPQWLGIPPFLGPPLGDTWYDSLQAKVTKRYSHGLDVQGAFTWQKELTRGVNSDTSYLTPQAPLINDVFNYESAKQISGFSRPLQLIISANYTTPGLHGDGTAMKAMSWAVRDWTFGAVLRYQSGALLRIPASNNGLLTQLGRGPSNNPALWGGGNTLVNRVNGVPLFLQDPDCHCIDPTQQLTLNPAAWQDVPAGQFGGGAPYYNDYRWQRQPQEAFNVGRNFRLAKEGKVNLNIRAEFQNVLNRVTLSAPSGGNISNAASPVSHNNPGGALSAGFGFANTFNGAGTSPRSGQIVARLTF
jgi:Carboxypeptidase regulatory-like domain